MKKQGDKTESLDFEKESCYTLDEAVARINILTGKIRKEMNEIKASMESDIQKIYEIIGE